MCNGPGTTDHRQVARQTEVYGQVGRAVGMVSVDIQEPLASEVTEDADSLGTDAIPVSSHRDIAGIAIGIGGIRSFIDAIAVAVYVPGTGAEYADLIRSSRAASSWKPPEGHRAGHRRRRRQCQDPKRGCC